jgi:Amt family ammonium transporter
MGFVDFAGSSVVHLAGAVSALAVSICVGPRHGKFTPTQTVTENQVETERVDMRDNKQKDEELNSERPSPMGLHEREDNNGPRKQDHFSHEKVVDAYEAEMGVYNVTYYGMGVMTLWFGWLYFNGGSTLSVQEAS